MLLNMQSIACTREFIAPNSNKAEVEKPAVRKNFMVKTGNLNSEW